MSAHASGGPVLPTPEEILQAAAVYCQMGWVPLATYVVVGSTDNGRPICSCYQGADCKNAGKHPIGRYADIDTAAKGYNQVYAAVQQGPCNLSIRTGAMSRISRVSAPCAAPASSARPSRWSEPANRGLASSIAVVAMPASRNAPGSRLMGRESACGGCGARVRLVADAMSTSTRPPSIFTA